MTWETEIAEISKRKELAKGRGGPEGVARQRRRGKLLVNERLDCLLDPGSLREFMSLVGRADYDDSGDLVGFTPKGSFQTTRIGYVPAETRREYRSARSLR